jgi:hypothetical protein
MAKNPTKQIRIYRSLDQELKLKFPEVRSADLLNIMYNTSALKAEAMLRKPKKPVL